MVAFTRGIGGDSETAAEKVEIVLHGGTEWEKFGCAEGVIWEFEITGAGVSRFM